MGSLADRSTFTITPFFSTTVWGRNYCCMKCRSQKVTLEKVSDAAVKISRSPLTLSLSGELIVTEWTERRQRQEAIDTKAKKHARANKHRAAIESFEPLDIGRSRDLSSMYSATSFVGRKCYVIVDGHFRSDDAVAALHPREKGCALVWRHPARNRWIEDPRAAATDLWH